jgi:hypothetical protein
MIKVYDLVSISLHFAILEGRERFDPYPVTEPDELIVLGDDAARSCSVQHQALVQSERLPKTPKSRNQLKIRNSSFHRRNANQTSALYALFQDDTVRQTGDDHFQNSLDQTLERRQRSRRRNEGMVRATNGFGIAPFEKLSVYVGCKWTHNG